MHLVMLAIIPQEPLKQELRLLMEHYCDVLGSTRALKMMPHITLTPPFLTNSLEQLVKDEETACVEFHCFGFELGKMDTFNNRVLILQVQSEELKQLHQLVVEPMAIHREHRWTSNNYTRKLSKRQRELVDKFGDPKVKEFYTPHFTLAKSDLDKQKLSEILANKPELELGTWIVNSVAVLVHNGKEWEVHAEVPLKN